MRILRYCTVQDMCVLSGVCRKLQHLAEDPKYWGELSKRVFPAVKLAIPAGVNRGRTLKRVYCQEFRKYAGIEQVWIARDKVLVIVAERDGIVGYNYSYIKLPGSALPRLGSEPCLWIAWCRENNKWLQPLSSNVFSDEERWPIDVELQGQSSELVLRKYPPVPHLMPLVLRGYSVREPSCLDSILVSGLFVEVSGAASDPCAITKIGFTDHENPSYMIMEKLTHLDVKRTISVSLNEVVDISNESYSNFPSLHKTPNSGELDLKPKPLPNSLIDLNERGVPFEDHVKTYRTVLSCVISWSYAGSESGVHSSPGFCVIYNEDIVTVYNISYLYPLYRAYLRVGSSALVSSDSFG